MTGTNSTIDGSGGEALAQYVVMVVDDEPYIIKSLQRLFRREPYSVVFAGSGAEGLQLLAGTSSVAVIVSDQRMPQMNGTDFLTGTRELAPEAFRMLLTGDSDIDATVAAMNQGGASHYISKPWQDTELLQAVRDGVRNYHLLQENRRQFEVINKQNLELVDLLTKLTDQNSELERLASTDVLTGLTNRRRFLDLLDKEYSRSRRYGTLLSVILVDVDHFKQVNDTWGHAAGDEVLKMIARVLGQVVRETDTAARIGGEEFVILLPETGPEGAAQTAGRLLEVVAATVVPQEQAPGISVTISIGVATISTDQNGEGLLQRADRAMYQAKSKGRNQLVAA